MTKPRIVVAESLAARGRPEYWANEQESAALSGMPAERFREKVEELEKAGFPKVCEWNGKRFVPAILAFWEQEHRRAALKPVPQPPQDGGPEQEDWSHERAKPRKRLTA